MSFGDRRGTLELDHHVEIEDTLKNICARPSAREAGTESRSKGACSYNTVIIPQRLERQSNHMKLPLVIRMKIE